MRVLHVSSSMDIGGAERALYQLIKLQSNSSDISPGLLVTAMPGIYYSKVEDIGVSCYSVSDDVRNVLSFIHLFCNFDIVHFHTPKPFLQILSIFCPSVKFVYTHRAGNHSYKGKRRMIYYISGVITKYFFAGISANTNHAGLVVKELFKLNANTIVHTTYNGIDFDLLKDNSVDSEILSKLGLDEKRNKILGTTGNFRECKRAFYIVDALSLLKKDFVAIFVGDGPESEKLKEYSQYKNVEERCFFVGKKQNVAEYLSVMDYFIFPSNEAESFGNSVVEAIGLGIPSIVMNDSPGVLEHMQYDNAKIARNVNEIATIIEYLNEFPDAYQKNSRCGMDYVQNKYTYENCHKSYLTFYQTLDRK